MGRRKLPDAILKKREQDVIALRKKNYSNQDIAETMGMSYATVMMIARQLIRQGRIGRYRPGRRPTSESERSEREQRIIECREQNMTHKEMTEATGLSQRMIAQTISQLAAQGRLQKYPLNESTFYYNPNHPRFKKIVAMVKQRATLEEIGAAIGTTRERARQLIAKMRKEHGDAIFQQKKKTLWTSKEAATEVSASERIVDELCRNGKIPFLQRGERQRLLNAKGLTALKKHPLITKKRTCKECGRMFILLKTTRHRKTCYSDTCAEKRRYRNNDRVLLQKKPRPESLRGWHGEVLRCLNDHTIGNNEQWMSNNDACLRAGINPMQLAWLRYRHILTVRPHPMKKGSTGNPVALYAASELDIVCKVYQARAPALVRG